VQEQKSQDKELQEACRLLDQEIGDLQADELNATGSLEEATARLHHVREENSRCLEAFGNDKKQVSKISNTVLFLEL
jgi:predicted nuclease with TOPRIM domain